MQEIILPDMLDGSVPIKNETLLMIKYICDYAKYITPHSVNSIHIQQPSEKEEIQFDDLLSILNRDESLKIFLRSYYEYKTHSHKNYVVAKTLTHAFSQTKIDIKGKYLPKDFTAYFEIRGLKDNDGEEIKGVFTRIANNSLVVGILTYNPISTGYSVSHFNSDLPKDEESIADKIKSFPYIEIGANLKNKTKSEVIDLIREGSTPEIKEFVPEYHNYIHVIFNCILYVTHCSELKDEINTFSTKRSKREWELKQYTKKSYTFVGRNFQVPKSYSAEDILVRGHWRWQPHGPERSLLKHIFIDPYLKNYRGDN